MRVILLRDIQGVGQKGSVKNVEGGYAVNHLIPQKLAVMATEEKIVELEKKRAEAEAASVKQLSEWKESAARLHNASVTIRMDANKKGLLYRHVPHKAIVERISKELGVPVDEKSLAHIKPIKSLGRAEIELEIGSKLVPFTVFVERDTP